MANSKISALTSATTPLAGTETLPVVQSSTTKQVSVANLTAGRAVSTAALTATGPLTAGANAAYTHTFKQNNDTAIVIYSDAASQVTLESVQASNSANKYDFYFSKYGGNSLFGGNVTLANGNLVQGTAAKGVNFTANTPAAGMTSRLLNWYEEGTWTPTVRFSGGSTGVTYSSQAGTYTRIGRQVTLNFDVRLSNKGTSTGVWEIGGFPFTAGSEGHGGLHFQSGGAGINALASIRVLSGTAYGGLYYASAGSTLNYAETDATNSSICIGQVIFFV